MALMDEIRKTTGLARIKAHMAWENLTDPYPTKATDVPRAAEYLTREWLTAVLCAKAPGAAVEEFTFVGEANIGTTARRNISVTYNAAGQSAGLPARLFAKASPELMTRWVCGLSGAIEHEVRFYNQIAPELTIEIPACYYAGYVPGAFRSMFLFEDAAVTKGATFLSGLTRLTRANAESMIRCLAGLHGRFWEDPRLDRTWTYLKDPFVYQSYVNDLIGYRDRTVIGLKESLDILPAAIVAKKDRLFEAYMHSCKLRADRPRTLVHTDIHLGNWYRTDAGVMGLCDWQCTAKGGWGVDIAYALSAGLEPEDRRAWESDLLRLYLDELRLPAGQQKPDFETAWLEYRRGCLHGFHSFLFVAGVNTGATALHSSEITVNNLKRMASALVDLDTMGSLGY